jgi:hypothetical protein
MSIKLKYVFPIANISDVCAAQTTAGAANLNLNGNLSDVTHNRISFITKGYSRQISLRSTGNLAGVVFTITGTQNGLVITENINGPNNNTVYSVLIYDVITSISSNAAVGTAITAGTGYQGFFPLIGINLEKDVINYTLSTAKLTAVSLHTTIFNTVDNIYNNGHTFLDGVNNNFNIFDIKASSLDDQFILPIANVIPCRFILVYINGLVGELGNSIQMNFIQS